MAGWVLVPVVWLRLVVADLAGFVDVRRVRVEDLGHGGHDLSSVTQSDLDVVRRGVVRDLAEERVSAQGLQDALGFGSYETAWAWLHKLRRAMVRPDRDLLDGVVELDQSFLGGQSKGKERRLE